MADVCLHDCACKAHTTTVVNTDVLNIFRRNDNILMISKKRVDIITLLQMFNSYVLIKKKLLVSTSLSL